MALFHNFYQISCYATQGRKRSIDRYQLTNDLLHLLPCDLISMMVLDKVEILFNFEELAILLVFLYSVTRNALARENHWHP